MSWITRRLLEPILLRPILRSIDWTEGDKAHFDSFCKSQAGIKLFEFLRQTVADRTFKAVYHNSVSANAHARGMQDLLAVFHRLRVFPVEQEESDMSLETAVQLPTNGPRKDAWNPYSAGSGAIGTGV